MERTIRKTQSILSLLYVLFAGSLIYLDQICKVWAKRRLEGQTSIPVIEDVFHFQYLEGGNSGAAWGMLSGKTTLLIVLVMVICLILFSFFMVIEVGFYRFKIKQEATLRFRILELFIVFIIAGGIGNVIDRIRLGYVIDFLYFKLINFPIFNVADCYVTVGVAGFIIMILFVIKESELNTLLRRRI